MSRVTFVVALTSFVLLAACYSDSTPQAEQTVTSAIPAAILGEAAPPQGAERVAMREFLRDTDGEEDADDNQ